MKQITTVLKLYSSRRHFAKEMTLEMPQLKGIQFNKCSMLHYLM